MNTIKTRIAIVLDRSTSMFTIRKEAVQMFNSQVASIKSNGVDQDTRVSLFTFSTIADEPTLFNVPAAELVELKESDYIPNGWTAMYDGIGLAIDRLSALKEATDKDCAFLVVVITDGEENHSTKFNGFTIGDRIKLLQSTGKWTFTFMGANVDVEKMSQTLHIPKGNTISWQASSFGATHAGVLNATATSNYMNMRSFGATASKDFYANQNVQGNGNVQAGGNVVVNPNQKNANK